MNNSQDLIHYIGFAEKLLHELHIPYQQVVIDEKPELKGLFSLYVYEASFCKEKTRILTLPQYLITDKASVLPSACLVLLHLIHQAAHAVNPTLEPERLQRCQEVKGASSDYPLVFQQAFLEEETQALETGLALIEQLDTSYIQWATGNPSIEKFQQLYTGFMQYMLCQYKDEEVKF